MPSHFKHQLLQHFATKVHMNTTLLHAFIQRQGDVVSNNAIHSTGVRGTEEVEEDRGTWVPCTSLKVMHEK